MEFECLKFFQKKRKKQSKKEKESRQSAGRGENARLSLNLKKLEYKPGMNTKPGTLAPVLHFIKGGNLQGDRLNWGFFLGFDEMFSTKNFMDGGGEKASVPLEWNEADRMEAKGKGRGSLAAGCCPASERSQRTTRLFRWAKPAENRQRLSAVP